MRWSPASHNYILTNNKKFLIKMWDKCVGLRVARDLGLRTASLPHKHRKVSLCRSDLGQLQKFDQERTLLRTWSQCCCGISYELQLALGCKLGMGISCIGEHHLPKRFLELCWWSCSPPSIRLRRLDAAIGSIVLHDCYGPLHILTLVLEWSISCVWRFSWDSMEIKE